MGPQLASFPTLEAIIEKTNQQMLMLDCYISKGLRWVFLPQTQNPSHKIIAHPHEEVRLKMREHAFNAAASCVGVSLPF